MLVNSKTTPKLNCNKITFRASLRISEMLPQARLPGGIKIIYLNSPLASQVTRSFGGS